MGPILEDTDRYLTEDHNMRGSRGSIWGISQNWWFCLVEKASCKYKEQYFCCLRWKSVGRYSFGNSGQLNGVIFNWDFWGTGIESKWTYLQLHKYGHQFDFKCPSDFLFFFFFGIWQCISLYIWNLWYLIKIYCHVLKCNIWHCLCTFPD